jgi:hypothetical protein
VIVESPNRVVVVKVLWTGRDADLGEPSLGYMCAATPEISSAMGLMGRRL